MSDTRRTIGSLRTEFTALLSQLRDQVAATDLCSSFELVKSKQAVFDCQLVMRQLLASATGVGLCTED